MARTSSTKNGTANKPVSVSVLTPDRASSAPDLKPAAARAPGAGATARPTQEQLGRRAYEIYLERCQGGKPGTPQGDWAQAEAELGRV